MKPTIVCLCGSTRFSDAFQRANLEETLAGRIVLTVGCMTHSDRELGEHVITPEIKVKLDALHKQKIDLADEILVLNVGGYIGESTRSEIAHAFAHGKRIRFLDEARGETWLQDNTHSLGREAARIAMGIGGGAMSYEKERGPFYDSGRNLYAHDKEVLRLELRASSAKWRAAGYDLGSIRDVFEEVLTHVWDGDYWRAR